MSVYLANAGRGLYNMFFFGPTISSAVSLVWMAVLLTSSKQPVKKESTLMFHQPVICLKMQHEVKDLRKDIAFYETDNDSIIKSFMVVAGYNFGRSPSIIASKNLRYLDQEGTKFLVLHELCHIRCSDSFKVQVLTITATIVSTLGVRYFRSCFPKWMAPFACFIPSLVKKTVSILYRRHCEARADRFACKHATVNELKGGIKIFTAIQQVQKEFYKIYPLEYTLEGDDRFDWSYPSLSKRIRMLTEALTARGGSVDNVEQNVALQREIDLIKLCLVGKSIEESVT